ncbi:hypothetical protein BD410DRAFT_783590 [Rickenella mellea]|uniref:Uncharacterized protein n=1 Tax=Rickenella mellea TaxID=50990 RepID=A0A4Y7QI90_9AGAM|nr:hypothetical protein BD410DRAFT_783590 [Rickenella mellea]
MRVSVWPCYTVRAARRVLWRSTPGSAARVVVGQSRRRLHTLQSTQPAADPLRTHNVNDTSTINSNSNTTEPDGEKQRHSDSGVSDQEWELRTGRATDILRQTLPDFFNTGLVASSSPPLSFESPSSSSNVSSPSSSGSTSHTHGNKGKGKERAYDDHEHTQREESFISGIYSRHIKLQYAPPVALPAPFPRTLVVDGHALYIASSAFIRHTLNALYTDISVEIRKFEVRRLGPGSSNDHNNGHTSNPSHRTDTDLRLGDVRNMDKRQKDVVVGIGVIGWSRLSGVRAEWDTTSTYTFSPLSGLIHIHTVDSIHPAPHETVYDALRASLSKLRLGGAEEGRGVLGITDDGCGDRGRR